MPRDIIVVSSRTHTFQAFGSGRPRARPPSGGEFFFGGGGVTVRRLGENSTAQIATNTVSETTISTLQIPATTLSSTGVARLSMGGQVFNKSVAAGTVTWRLKYTVGATTATILATSGVVCSTSLQFRKWGLEVLTLGKQPGQQHNWGVLDLTAASSRSWASHAYSAVGYSTSALDETQAITVTLTAQMSGASTGFRVHRNAALLEGVN